MMATSTAVFNHENFKAHSGQTQNPSLYKRVAVDGGATTGSDALDEASLDVQEAITGAPGSHVILYELPSLSDENIIDGYTRVISDNEADVVSSSFGACELTYTAAYNGGADETATLDLEHELFLQGNAQGITFLASSGDSAGLGCPSVNNVTNDTAGVFVRGVSVPAADPNVTGVGGTNVVTNSSATSLNSTYVKENAYGDPLVPYDAYGVGADLSGGYWGCRWRHLDPLRQAGLPRHRRHQYRIDQLPNLAGCRHGRSEAARAARRKRPATAVIRRWTATANTDRSSVVVAIHGSFAGLIGTSVASPELAGAVALLVEQYRGAWATSTRTSTLSATPRRIPAPTA